MVYYLSKKGDNTPFFCSKISGFILILCKLFTKMGKYVKIIIMSK